MAEAHPGRVGRRLAAIVAADVAGYSRLMGLDEVGTARTLLEHRKVEPVSVLVSSMPFRRMEDRERYKEGLLQAGFPA